MDRLPNYSGRMVDVEITVSLACSGDTTYAQASAFIERAIELALAERAALADKAERDRFAYNGHPFEGWTTA